MTAQAFTTKTGGPRLSAAIVAQDEERTIARALSSLMGIADEIVFIDSGSSDRTVEIAKSFGVRLFHQQWLGYAAQKNMAIDLATGDWILSLDADEVLTPALAEEIRNLLRLGVPDPIAAFKIPRVLFIGDSPVRGGGFYPDAQLRLIRKGKGRFGPRLVHESIQVEGKVAQLKHDMLHYAYRDIGHFADTMEAYARLSAREYFENHYRPWGGGLLNELARPLWTLFYRQIIRGGFLRGRLCWQLNLTYAAYVRKKIRYLRQLQQSNQLSRPQRRAGDS